MRAAFDGVEAAVVTRLAVGKTPIEVRCEPMSAAGKLVIDEASEGTGLYCDPFYEQCAADHGWWWPWQGLGQVNVALLLMVIMGFLGASLATREGRHLAVDAIDRVLSPGPARFVKRFAALVSAGLCFVLALASWNKIVNPAASADEFPSAYLWWWMAEPINWVVSVLPGAKYGPGTPWASRGAWEQAMFPDGVPFPAAPRLPLRQPVPTAG